MCFINIKNIYCIKKKEKTNCINNNKQFMYVVVLFKLIKVIDKHLC